MKNDKLLEIKKFVEKTILDCENKIEEKFTETEFTNIKDIDVRALRYAMQVKQSLTKLKEELKISDTK